MSNDPVVVKTNVPLPHPKEGDTSFLYGTYDANDPSWKVQEARTGGPAPDDSVIFNGYLIPVSIKFRLRKFVIQAVRDLRFEDGVTIRVAQLTPGPATTLTITSPILDGSVSVDFGPLLCTNKTIEACSLQWPRAGKCWPDKNKVRALSAIGVDYVGKETFDWSSDSVRIEKSLFRDIDEDGGCRKKSQRILKKLKDDVFSPKNVKAIMSSYCLKNALLWECEDHPDASDWTNDKLVERVLGMTSRLLKWLREGKIPWYFHDKIDVLRLKPENKTHADKTALNMERFLRNPADEIRRVTQA